MTLLAYLSHPVGPGNGHAMAQKHDNIANAGEWLNFLVESTRWAIVCPWLPYLMALGSDTHRPRGLIDQLFVLERCDLLVLCGGWTSPHMRLEVTRAHRHGIPVLDLTDYGDRPPTRDKEAGPSVTLRAAAAIQALPRRIWLPPVTQNEVRILREARSKLREFTEYDEASEYLRRIIIAAGNPPDVR